MQNNDLVSIICVTKNAAQYLEDFLQSVFKQTYKNIELIIFDAVSTDGTIDILKKWDDRITFWRSEPDNGIYDAMNKALDRIHGKWVYFIGADDILLSEFSDFVSKELSDYNTVYYANVIYKNEKHRGQMDPYRQLKNGVLHQATIYPYKVFQKYKYKLKYKISADHILNIEIFGDHDFNFKYCEYTIANFNHTGISSLIIDLNMEKDKPMLALKHFGIMVFIRYQMRMLKKKIFQR